MIKYTQIPSKVFHFYLTYFVLPQNVISVRIIFSYFYIICFSIPILTYLLYTIRVDHFYVSSIIDKYIDKKFTFYIKGYILLTIFIHIYTVYWRYIEQLTKNNMRKLYSSLISHLWLNYQWKYKKNKI